MKTFYWLVFIFFIVLGFTFAELAFSEENFTPTKWDMRYNESLDRYELHVTNGAGQMPNSNTPKVFHTEYGPVRVEYEVRIVRVGEPISSGYDILRVISYPKTLIAETRELVLPENESGFIIFEIWRGV